jgi:hypothetical protein
MTRTHCCIAAALGMLVAQAGAAPYWITYEGNDLPENEGWTRYWGNWDGPYEGDGAIRTVEDGILTMDSLFDPGVYDYARVDRPGQIDPGPGEVFVMEWRALVQQTAGEPSYDLVAAVASDDAWMLSFGIYPNGVVSNFEHVGVSIEPGVFHEYSVVSADMRTYTLCIDGETALIGDFWEGLTESRIAWGDFVQNVASYSHWDYVRVGVIPEPASFLLLWVLYEAGLHTRSRMARHSKETYKCYRRQLR